MLTKFAVKNYRGFSERIEWDLSHPSCYTFNTYSVKNGIVKNGIVYGPNGSGKTNLGLAVFDIVFHLSQKFKINDYYDNFVFAGNNTALVDFEYTFRFGEQTLEYKYSKAFDGSLINESLDVDGKNIFDHCGRELTIDIESFPLEKSYIESLATSANNVSIVNALVSSFPLKDGHYLLKLRDFVNGMLWFRNLDVREFIGLETNIFVLDEYIIKNNLVYDFGSFIESVSGQKFTFAKHSPSDKKLLCKFGDELVPFSQIASTGTNALTLLYFWIQRMKKATFVFIDEFDAFYHFELSFQVCKRLFTLDCQVFTSSHNTYLMTNDLLRPDCNFILNHNKIKPLCECTDKELRLGHNIEKLYRGNTFQV